MCYIRYVMKDIDKAKSLLKDDKTLVLVKDNEIIDSKLSGIKPLLTFLDKKTNLEGFSLADKIIGKAQAMLCVKAKINIETAEVVENNGLKPADLKKAVDAVKQYKEELIKAWNEYFDEN